MALTLVCGSRFFVDYRFVCRELTRHDVTAVVHGDCVGVDRLAGRYAREHGHPEIRVPANWDIYGSSAGPERNQWMLDFTKVDRVIAFLGGSGTRNMMRLARLAGVPVIRIKKDVSCG
jgi:hypothetical protein